MASKVKDIMSPDLVVVELDATVLEVRHRLREHVVQALPVVDVQGRPIAIVTSTDLLKTTRLSTRVHRIATLDVVTVTEETTISSVARIMREHRIHHVVVVRRGKAVGMLSSFDLLRVLERGSRIGSPTRSRAPKK